MKHFTYIDPLGRVRNSDRHDLQHIDLTDEQIGSDNILLQTLRRMDDLAAVAMLAYRGSFAPELSTWPCKEMCDLPWASQYWKLRRGRRTFSQRNISEAQIEHIADFVCGSQRDPSRPPFGSGWLDEPNEEDEKLAVQAFAIEILLCLDGAISHILNGHAAEAVRWSTAAHSSLINVHQLADDRKWLRSSVEWHSIKKRRPTPAVAQ